MPIVARGFGMRGLEHFKALPPTIAAALFMGQHLLCGCVVVGRSPRFNPTYFDHPVKQVFNAWPGSERVKFFSCFLDPFAEFHR